VNDEQRVQTAAADYEAWLNEQEQKAAYEAALLQDIAAEIAEDQAAYEQSLRESYRTEENG
jgi:hypothetical protein